MNLRRRMSLHLGLVIGTSTALAGLAVWAAAHWGMGDDPTGQSGSPSAAGASKLAAQGSQAGAAPQVHESLRLFVAGFAPGPGDPGDDEEDDEDGDVPLMAIINPEITPIGDETVEDWEGCLSIPDVRGRVSRAKEIEVKAYDRKGRKLSMRARGFTARVIQHETDHLDGVLFFDRMKSLETLTFLDEFGRYWNSRHREIPEE